MPDDALVGPHRTARPKFLQLICAAPGAGRSVAEDAASLKSREIDVSFPRNFPSHYTIDANGEPAGFAIDVIKEIAGRAGLRLNFAAEDTWAAANEALRIGRADLIPNIAVTEKRKSFTSFTTPVESFDVVVFTRTDNSDINSLADLDSHSVGVAERNVAETLLSQRDGVTLAVFPDSTLAKRALSAKVARLRAGVRTVTSSRWTRRFRVRLLIGVWYLPAWCAT